MVKIYSILKKLKANTSITVMKKVGVIVLSFLTIFFYSCNEMNKETASDKDLIFPKGDKVESKNFNGNVWLKNLVSADSLNDIKIGSVTFEAGAHTAWHYHPGGQILMVMSGTGYYQEKGGEKKILHKGDVIKCAPNVPHWHGASKDDEFIQVAVTAVNKGETVWLQPVTDEEYNAAK
jgi:quercetin dioxygenase-like cupin family protein